jgi:hypothetical protein
MEELRLIIRILTVASLGLAALQIYLSLNKLWSRKHERIVAESISIYGELVGLVPLFFLTTNFFFEAQWAGVVDGLLWLSAGAVTIAIGTGMWVEGRRGRRFWSLLRDAMAVERTEVGDLAKSFFRPPRADAVLDLLANVALIDEDLDERERAFIQSFARAWGIDLDWEVLRARKSTGGAEAIRLRQMVADYLSTSPPTSQVEQLGDVFVALVHADEEVTTEEELILGEIEGMFSEYLGRADLHERFAVALVPQSDLQDQAIRSFLPELEKEEIAGGTAYVVGRFFSNRYAEVVSQQYRSLNVFTSVLRSSGTEA